MLPRGQQKLTAVPRHPGAFFGLGLAISDDTLVVGASQDNGTGSAYVFERRGAHWVFSGQKLTAKEGRAGDQFGEAIAIHGETIVIGAVLDDEQGDGAGAAYIFERHAGIWSQQKKLTATDGAADSLFGIAVAISPEAIVIGASYHNTNVGAAYVIERYGTNNAQQKLIAKEVQAEDFFGASVAISGRTVVVGAPSDIRQKSVKGSAYVFQG